MRIHIVTHRDLDIGSLGSDISKLGRLGTEKKVRAYSKSVVVDNGLTATMIYKEH